MVALLISLYCLAYHQQCLRPSLATIPAGAWLCPTCTSKGDVVVKAEQATCIADLYPHFRGIVDVDLDTPRKLSRDGDGFLYRVVFEDPAKPADWAFYSTVPLALRRKIRATYPDAADTESTALRSLNSAAPSFVSSQPDENQMLVDELSSLKDEPSADTAVPRKAVRGKARRSYSEQPAKLKHARQRRHDLQPVRHAAKQRSRHQSYTRFGCFLMLFLSHCLLFKVARTRS